MLGRHFLHYQIDAHLGSGGMGEVYRALDTRLGRSVAIKLLPELFAQDVERVARFEREARLLASLNHPNIAALHGLETADGRHLLVMELVDGETLAQRIQRGPIPVAEALVIARQISEALEAAHDKGVVHRDLKPANVKLTLDGKVKVLDFGLAKAVEDGAQANVMNSPTVSIAATHAGVILGTAAYMSPEQAKGVATDHRSDIFSFGCVLYEMLTGRQSFQGDTMTEVIASVLKTDPDLALLPPTLHPRIVELLRRCLAKDPRRRWHAVADVRVEIESILADPQGLAKGMAAVATPLWRRAVPLAVTALAAAALSGVAVWLLRPRPDLSPARFSIMLPPAQQLTRTGRHNLAMSPDGRSLVYVADNQLYLRTLDDLQARPIQGTLQDITTPVFSPDGRWVAFYSFADSTLKRVALTGGASITLAGIANPFGASWTDDGFLLVGQGSQGIMRVPENGGEPERIAAAADGEVLHGPQMLPGGEHVLFTAANSGGARRWDEARIVAQSLRSGQRTVLVEGGSDARYVPTGHLVYALGGNLFAMRFDAGAMRTVGGPIPILERVMRSSAVNTAATFFTFSRTGSLAYFAGDQIAAVNRVFAWIDRAGAESAIPIDNAILFDPRLSPDGRQILARTDSDSSESNLWIYDISGKAAPRRLTFGGSAQFPAWSPDGTYVAYFTTGGSSGDARKGDGIYWQRADGSGVAERLAGLPEAQPTGDLSFSRDGKVLLFRDGRGDGDIWMIPLQGDRKPQPAIQMAGNQFQPSLSADGRWIAYVSLESAGLPTVFVQPFPPTGARYQVSTIDARAPLWSADGRQLYYLERAGGLNVRRLMAVDVETSGGFAIGRPRPIFDRVDNGGAWPYAVARDGRWLAVVRSDGGDAANPQGPDLRVTLNWFEELRQRVPAD
jgi:serine/threonine-protein kinase